MRTRSFALVFGLLFLAIGILGFVRNLAPLPGDAPPLAIDWFYGYLFGLFPVNLLDNLFYLSVGLSGLSASRAWDRARRYGRRLSFLLATLAVFGLVPGFDRLFGFLPLFGQDIWLHALTALVAAYFGIAAEHRRVGQETTLQH